MNVIRPIMLDDLDALYEMAAGAGYGLTSLPRDRESLHNKIAESQESFARIGQKPRGESYLFVLEDLETRRAVGTTGAVAKVGGFEPFYAYKIETAVAESAALKVRKEIAFLELDVPPGKYRSLTPQEVDHFQRIFNARPAPPKTSPKAKPEPAKQAIKPAPKPERAKFPAKFKPISKQKFPPKHKASGTPRFIAKKRNEKRNDGKHS